HARGPARRSQCPDGTATQDDRGNQGIGGRIAADAAGADVELAAGHGERAVNAIDGRRGAVVVDVQGLAIYRAAVQPHQTDAIPADGQLVVWNVKRAAVHDVG